MAKKKLLTAAWTRLFTRQLTAVTRKALGTTLRKTLLAAAGAPARRPALSAKPATKAKASRPRAASRSPSPNPAPAKRRSSPGAGVVAKVKRLAIGSKARARPDADAGDWVAGVAIAVAGARRWRLYRPKPITSGERLPLLVMLHGCGQDASSFALSTRINRIASRERFLVLYPEQDRLANAQGCWNWFDTRNGRAQGEVALVLRAIDQACGMHGADPTRVAVAGMSAGASLAALLATRHPERFKAVVMHSGVPPGRAHSGLSALAAMRGLGKVQHLATKPAARAAAAVATMVPWPPLLVIQGEADPVVAPSNGRAAVLAWAQAAGALPGPPRRLQRGQRHAMTVTDYACRGRAVASLVMVEHLGHVWSGGAATQPYGDPKGPDASRLAWAFVAKQFKA